LLLASAKARHGSPLIATSTVSKSVRRQSFCELDASPLVLLLCQRDLPAAMHARISANKTEPCSECFRLRLLARLSSPATHPLRYDLEPMYPCGMDKMDDVLALLTPDELPDGLWFVEVWEKAGHMSQEGAHEWRTRIEAWARFQQRQRPRRPKKVDLPIVELPDQFLS